MQNALRIWSDLINPAGIENTCDDSGENSGSRVSDVPKLAGKTTHLVAWRHSSTTSVQMAGTDVQVLKARTRAGELNILQ